MGWDQTNIFSYFDGEKQVWADPLEIHHGLAAALDGDVNKILAATRMTCEDARQQAAVRHDAMQRLVPAIREVFKLLPFDPNTGTGATWRACIAVFSEFVKWEDALKKNGGFEPTPYSGAVESTS
jgi:hypothetical protein